MFNDYTLKPMLLQEIPKPFNNSNYLYEIKFDGYRAFIYACKNKVTVISRNGKDITNIYPELQSIKKIVKDKKVIFDGEIIAVSNGLPNFHNLAMRSKKTITENTRFEIPIYFICFDIIYENKDLTKLPLIKRKVILDTYPDTSEFIKSESYSDGLKLFQKIQKLGLEGIVAKEKSSLYYPGKRVNSWLKIKNLKEAKYFIGGFIFNKEKYSLLLGEYRHKNLYYVGKVSISSNNPLLKQILNQPKTTNKFVNYSEKATFITPKIKVLVTYLEKTLEGKLRHPVLK